MDINLICIHFDWKLNGNDGSEDFCDECNKLRQKIGDDESIKKH